MNVAPFHTFEWWGDLAHTGKQQREQGWSFHGARSRQQKEKEITMYPEEIVDMRNTDGLNQT